MSPDEPTLKERSFIHLSPAALYRSFLLPVYCDNLHPRLLRRAAVYKVFGAPACASVYPSERLMTRRCGAFHTDNMLFLNTSPTTQEER